MPDNILLEDGSDMLHEGNHLILLEGQSFGLTIPTRTALGLQSGDEVIDTGYAAGDESLTTGYKVGDETIGGLSA
jgi:hypothetical protein